MGFIKSAFRIAAPIVGGIVGGGPIGAMIGGAIGGAVGNRGNVLKNAVIGGATSYFGAKMGADLVSKVGETGLGGKIIETIGKEAATNIGRGLGVIGANLAAQKIAEGFQAPMPPAYDNNGEISQGTPLPSFDQLQKESANKAQIEMNKSLNAGFRLRNPLDRPFFMGPPKNLRGEIPFSIRRKQKTQKELKKERYQKWLQTTRIK